jgi:hypothetical protein
MSTFAADKLKPLILFVIFNLQALRDVLQIASEHYEKQLLFSTFKELISIGLV